jgi:hypothetical protein
MSNAFDLRETVEISGDISEAIEAHLGEEFCDGVLDFQIYYNDRGEHSVAIGSFAFPKIDQRPAPPGTDAPPSSKLLRRSHDAMERLDKSDVGGAEQTIVEDERRYDQSTGSSLGCRLQEDRYTGIEMRVVFAQDDLVRKTRKMLIRSPPLDRRSADLLRPKGHTRMSRRSSASRSIQAAVRRHAERAPLRPLFAKSSHILVAVATTHLRPIRRSSEEQQAARPFLK